MARNADTGVSRSAVTDLTTGMSVCSRARYENSLKPGRTMQIWKLNQSWIIWNGLLNFRKVDCKMSFRDLNAVYPSPSRPQAALAHREHAARQRRPSHPFRDLGARVWRHLSLPG